MTTEQLLNRLYGIEWNYWEVKEAYLLTEAGLRLLESRKARQKDQEKTQ